ncbi:MAG: TonB-dependent receptor [Acidobacteria bacterium]|nr:TonB-dependent receptor [Acidobacteriota bacterium]
MRIFRIATIAACLAMWISPAAAQQSIDFASVSGRVTDPSGAAVPDAEVVAQHTGTNVTTQTTTDEEGRFRFPYLRVGSYAISVRHQGFAESTQALTLTVGSAFELPLSLSLAGVSANVTVTGQTEVLEAARSQIAGTVSEVELRTLPMSGRNFLEVALLIPGVSPTNTGSAQLFPETSAVPGISLSVGSQRNLSNNFIVDGLSSNDDAAALSGMTYGLDAIEEFQVVTSGGHAELGRALGGYFNVVTKSGTNELHGTLYGYGRDDRFTAANRLSGATLPLNESQYGASLGGPLAKNQTFYFVNAERKELDQSGLVTVPAASVDIINARLAAVGYRGGFVTTGVYPNPVHSTNVLAKVDHQLNGRDQFSVRYGLYDVTSRNARGAGGLTTPSASSALDNIDQMVAFGNTLTLSARTVLETRAQWARGDLDALPSDPVGPTVTIAGVATFGRLSTSPTGRLNTLYQVVNNVSHQAGAHALRAGVDFLQNTGVVTFPRAAGGAYTFSSLANFLSGTYNNSGFLQTFGATDVSYSNPNVGVYAQDEWKAGSSLTLNLGLRYDLQFLDTVATDIDNVSPRVGAAWSPFASRRTLVRGSAGLFYDRVPLRALANALLSAGNTTDVTRLRQISVNLSPAQAGAPVFPSTLGGAVPSVTLPNLTTMDSDLRNAHSRQMSVELEQHVGAATTMSVGYQYLRGLQLLMSINQNVPTCVAAGTNNGCRPNPDFANNSQYSSTGESSYHGMHVSIQQRPSDWSSYRVSYTLSTSKNNVGEFFFSSPIDPFDISKDWGRSDDDQRHRLVVSGTVTAPMEPATSIWERLIHGFQLSGILQTYSALPFNITSGVTTLQGTAGRPVVNGTFIGRNAGLGSDFFSLNARVSRTFRLRGRLAIEGMAEGFNLTNRFNALTRNTTFGAGRYPDEPSPAFAQVTAAGEPRSFKFGARVRF